MALSPIGEKVLENLQNQRQLSDVGQAVIENSQNKAFADSLHIESPIYGDTGNSTVAFEPGLTSSGPHLVAKMLGQGIARSYASTGAYLAKNLFHTKETTDVNPSNFFGDSETAAKFGHAFFGTDEVFNAEKEGGEIFEMLGLHDATPWQKASFAVLLTSADLFTGGMASQGAKGFLFAIRHADDVAEAARLMRNVGFDEGIISDYASTFAKTKDTKTIADAFQAAAELQSTTRIIEGTATAVIDGTKPLTVSGKTFESVANGLRESVVELFNANRALVGDESRAIENSILRNITPTVAEYRTALNLFEEAGVDISQATARLDEVSTTMKTDPARFVPDFEAQTKLDLPLRERGVYEYTLERGFYDAPYLAGNKQATDALGYKDYSKAEYEDIVRMATPLEGGDELWYHGYRTEEQLLADKEAGKMLLPETGGEAQYLTKDYEYALGYAGDNPAFVAEVRIPQKINEKDLVMWGDEPFTASYSRGGAKQEEIGDLPFNDFKVADSKISKLDEVADPVRDNLSVLDTLVQSRYGEESVTVKNAKKVSAAGKSVVDEMTSVVNGKFEYGTWVPTNLRNPALFEDVTNMINRGDYPAVHGSGEMELYTVVTSEIARRAGIDSKNVRAVQPETAVTQSMRERSGTPIIKRTRDTSPKAKNIDDAEVDFGKPIQNIEEALEDYKKYERGTNKSNNTKKYSKSDIDSWNIKGATDISGFKARVKDVYRNSEKVFGDSWANVKKQIFDPFDDAKGAMVRAQKVQTDNLMREVVGGLGIKKRSKLSAMVQKYGEEIMSYDEVVKAVGKDDAAKVVKADKFFRSEYDRMIDEVNAVRKEMFPGRADKQIKKRTNYYRHFQEMTDAEGAFKAFEDPGLGNLANKTKSKNRWVSMAQERLGSKTEYDAVGGFLDYVPQYAFIKHVDPQTQKLMEFTDTLRKNTAGELDGYINHLDMITDDLNGIANFADRFVEGFVGRRVLNSADYLNKRVKRNAILGNAGTAISQIFNVPNAVSTAGPINTAEGIVQSLLDVIDPSTAKWGKGNFIPERYVNDMYNQFNVGMLDNGMQFAGWMVSILDEVGTKFAWNAHYAKAIRTMPDVDAIRYADDMARKSVAGRGVGEVPILQKSKTFQMVAPFQLEVANVLFVVGEQMSKKEISKLVTFAVATYALNEAAEKITGREVTMNPGQVLMDSIEIAKNENTVFEKSKQITGRALGEVITGVPLAPYVASAILTDEEREILGMTLPSSEDFFGEADPIKYGAPQPLLFRALNVTEWDSAMDPFLDFVTPYGGAQIQKTINGVSALAEGGVYDKNGNKMMDVKPGGAGALQNILFGHWNPNVQYKEKIEEELAVLVRENNELVKTELESNYDIARQNYNDLSPEIQAMYSGVKSMVDAKDKTRAENKMRPTLKIIETLKEQNKIEDARAITEAMSDDEKEIMISLVQRLEKEDKDGSKPEDWENHTLIGTVLDYAYAYGTNPVQAFEIMFKNHEVIEDTIGDFIPWKPSTWDDYGQGVVRTRRMPFKDYKQYEGSGGVKSELMDKAGVDDSKSVKLEHLVPLGMGGNNLRSNLRLVSNRAHDAWTPVENSLIEAIKDDKIDYKTAQELILRHKGIMGEPITYAEIKAIINSK